MTIENLGTVHSVDVIRPCALIGVALRTLHAAWQSFDEEARHAVPHKRSPSPDAYRRTTGKQDFLESQRSVVIVSQIGTSS